MLFYVVSEYYDDLFQCYEMQYYIAETTPAMLQKRLNIHDIDIGCGFFDLLENRIKSLSNPLDEDQELKLYIDIFKEQNPSQEEEAVFKSVIQRNAARN